MDKLASKKIIWSLVSVFLLVCFGYYFYSTTQKKIIMPVAQRETIYYLAWIGPLTGSTAWLGVDSLKATKLAIEEYNQRKKPEQPRLELITADNDGGKRSLQEYAKLVKKYHPQVAFVIYADDIMQLAKYAARDRVILVDPIDNDRGLLGLSSNVFLIGKTTESLASVLADRMVSLQQTKALVIYYANNSFMVTLAKNFKQALAAAGGEAYLTAYGNDTTHFKALLRQGQAKQVDAYVFFGHANIGFAIKEARNMGIKKAFYAANAGAELVANAQKASENLQFPDFTYLDGNPLLGKAFIKKYQTKFQARPSVEWTALQSYDATWIVIAAIEKALTLNGDDLVSNIRDSLLNTKAYEGVSGFITISPDGSSKGIYPGLYYLQDGQPVKLKSNES